MQGRQILHLHNKTKQNKTTLGFMQRTFNITDSILSKSED